jgi:3-phenylpropionate/cinnamic acid dioxygenase small subunit
MFCPGQRTEIRAMDQANAFHTLSERLQHLEDLEEIRRLYIAYGRHLDDGNVAAYVALFSRDAKLRLGPVMRADGSAEIESAVTALLKSMESADRAVHVIGAPQVDLGEDAATGECVWAAVSQLPDGASSVLVGRHVDELVREDGRWRFARRTGLIDVGAVSLADSWPATAERLSRGCGERNQSAPGSGEPPPSHAASAAHVQPSSKSW